MTFDQWDIAVALFPFAERSAAKPRPVAVLSDRRFNHDHGLVVAGMITTAASGRWASDCALTELASTGLRQSCVIRWKIMTLSAEMVSRKIGVVAHADRAIARLQLAAIFPLGEVEIT